MKIWVIGAKGMLGSTLLECCRRDGIEAIGTCHQEADICQLDQLKGKARMIKPSHIVNCAAYMDLDGAEKDVMGAYAINAEGAANAALVAKELHSRLIHISTDYVFSGEGSQPYREEDYCAPINVYGKSKREGEKKVLSIWQEACILRTSWIFGLKGKNFISSLLSWFQDKEELNVPFDQYTKPTYCFDLAEAVLATLDLSGIIHFANEGGGSRYQIALDFLDITKKQGIKVKCKRILPVPSSQFPTLAKRPPYSVLDTTKYFRLTSKKPRLWTEAAADFLKSKNPLIHRS